MNIDGGKVMDKTNAFASHALTAHEEDIVLRGFLILVETTNQLVPTGSLFRTAVLVLVPAQIT